MSDKSIEEIDFRFKSGNQIPVDRAYVTMGEWELIKQKLDSYKAENEELKKELDSLENKLEEVRIHGDY